MPTPLRAFLMLTDGLGGWDIHVHRDLEALIKSWLDRRGSVFAAVVHIGFERSASSSFDEIVGPHAGRVLLTQAARHALPRGFHTSSRPVADHEDGEIYLATTGWGYDASHEIFDALAVVGPGARPPYLDWLPRFVSAYPEHEPALAAAGIFDEITYQERERQLDRPLKALLGERRYEALGGLGSNDPCEIAQALPPWLTDRNVALLDLTVRLSNVFSSNGIVRVGDLRDWSLERLLRLKNFGRTSAKDLQLLLLKALEKGPPIDEWVQESTSPSETTLLSALSRTLDALPIRASDILRRRMGFGMTPQTLAEIGDDYGVTRERIRQIEAKTLKRLLLLESWDDLLTTKLAELLSGRRFPLPLLGVEAVDPWFEAVGEHGPAVAYLLDAIGSRVSVVQVDGVDYLALMTPARWETAISEAKKLLASGGDKGWTESHCKVLINALLPAEAAEFASLFWTNASQHCVFVGDGDECVLHTYGRGAEQIVSGVLEESSTPLHYSEIAERAARKLGREVDPRRAHNAAAEVGLLMGPGTYGARKHLRLSPAEMDALAQIAEDIVFEGGDRQWHCGEIIDLINEQGVDGAVTLADRYHLDVALKDRGSLSRLGRMMWSQPGALSEARRLEVREAIIAVLQAADGPLGTEAIRQSVCALRGVGQHFQIVASDPLLKIGTARWGLNDRDLTIKRSDQAALLAEVVEALHVRGSGVHITEIGDLIAREPAIDGEELFALNVLDDRLSASLGRYLYLREWGEPRRETLSGAIRAIMIESEGKPLSIESLVERAEARVGRAVRKNFVYKALQELGAELVAPSVWRYDATAGDHYGAPAEDDYAPDAAGLGSTA